MAESLPPDPTTDNDPTTDSASGGSPPETAAETGPKPARSATARDPQAYWRANRRLIAILLSIWATVSYGCGILFIDQLNKISIGNLPLGFWFAQQGSICVFVVLIFVYALAMDWLDRKHGVKE